MSIDKNKLPFADTVILPRDKERNKKKHLAILKELGAQDVQGLPEEKRGTWMSIQRNVTRPNIDTPDAPPLREQIEERLKRSTITIYVAEDNDQPTRIAIEPPITAQEVYEIYSRAGYPDIKKPKRPNYPAINCVGLLVETSKMGCYSWNLPAGPNNLGGTCPASALGFMYSTREQLDLAQRGLRDPETVIRPQSFICNGCYALKGAYGAPSNIFYMAMKLFVTRRLLDNELAMQARRGGGRRAVENLRYLSAENYRKAKKLAKKQGVAGKKSLNDADVIRWAEANEPELLEPVDFGFSELMFLAIENARKKVSLRRSRLEHFGYTAAMYEATEKSMSLAKNRTQARKLIDRVEMAKTDKARKQADDELKVFLDRARLSVDEVLAPAVRQKKKAYTWDLPDPDYFRIHDAGDFYSDAYFKAWSALCASIPDVHFWAPTRVWSFKGILTRASLEATPKNLALRPSALEFGEWAPSSSYMESLGLPIYKNGGGVSAASGSAKVAPDPTAWKCPAYEHWSLGGGALRLDPKTGKGVGGTCITARGPNGENGCRACWRYNDTIVFYEEH